MFSTDKTLPLLGSSPKGVLGLETAIQRLEKFVQGLQCPKCGIIVDSANDLMVLEEVPQKLHPHGLMSSCMDKDEDLNLRPHTIVVCCNCWKTHHHSSIEQQESFQRKVDSLTLAQIFTQNADRFTDQHDEPSVTSATSSRKTPTMVDPFLLLQAMKQLYQQHYGNGDKDTNYSDLIGATAFVSPPSVAICENQQNLVASNLAQTETRNNTMNETENDAVSYNQPLSQKYMEVDEYCMEKDAMMARATAASPQYQEGAVPSQQFSIHSNIESHSQSTGESIATYMLPETADFMAPSFRDRISIDVVPGAYSQSESIASSTLAETAEFSAATPGTVPRKKARFNDNSSLNSDAPTKSPRSADFFDKRVKLDSSGSPTAMPPDKIENENSPFHTATLLSRTGRHDCVIQSKSARASHTGECADDDGDTKRKSIVESMTSQAVDTFTTTAMRPTTLGDATMPSYADFEEQSYGNSIASDPLPETADAVSTKKARGTILGSLNRRQIPANVAETPSSCAFKTAEIKTTLREFVDLCHTTGSTTSHATPGENSFDDGVKLWTEGAGNSTPVSEAGQRIIHSNSHNTQTLSPAEEESNSYRAHGTRNGECQSQRCSIATTVLPDFFIASASQANQWGDESVGSHLLPETSEFFRASTTTLHANPRMRSPGSSFSESFHGADSCQCQIQEIPETLNSRMTSIDHQSPDDSDIQETAYSWPSLPHRQRFQDPASPARPSHVCYDQNQPQPQSQLSHRLAVEESATMSVLTGTYDFSAPSYVEEMSNVHMSPEYRLRSSPAEACLPEEGSGTPRQVKRTYCLPRAKPAEQNVNRIYVMPSPRIPPTGGLLDSSPNFNSHVSHSFALKLAEGRIQNADVTPVHFPPKSTSKAFAYHKIDPITDNLKPKSNAIIVTPSNIDDTMLSGRWASHSVTAKPFFQDTRLVIADILPDESELNCLRFLHDSGICEMLPPGDREEPGSWIDFSRPKILVTYSEKCQLPVVGSGIGVSGLALPSDSREVRASRFCVASCPTSLLIRHSSFFWRSDTEPPLYHGLLQIVQLSEGSCPRTLCAII
jgi:hypothetical protein